MPFVLGTGASVGVEVAMGGFVGGSEFARFSGFAPGGPCVTGPLLFELQQLQSVDLQFAKHWLRRQAPSPEGAASVLGGHKTRPGCAAHPAVEGGCAL